MELPQPRPYGTEGRKPTHDFLSLCSHSSAQQDPRPPPSQGGYLKTHDFLQPLERTGNSSAKQEETGVEISTVEKQTPPPSIEHILPGGIGTYSISHISYFNQKVPKPEGSMFTVAQTSSTDRNDENSNSSSYTGSGFTLWEESSSKKGKTGKENMGENPIVTGAEAKLGQWPVAERPSHSSTNNNHRNSFGSLSPSQATGQKNKSFVEMIKSAKVGITQEDDIDEEEFVLKKEPSTTVTPIHKGELRVKVDAKTSDQKANTPRSKHSATEQRRRSKINDRFQMLRELIPHSDQKRDKASFLLEVIEYIQFLQEKVQKYEGPYQGWNHEPEKLMPWRNNHRPVDCYADQSRGINSGSASALVFAGKCDEKNICVSPTVAGSGQNPVESDISTATTFKQKDHHPGITNTAMPFPMSLQPNFFTPVRTSGSVPEIPPKLASDVENIPSQPQPQFCQMRSCPTDGIATSDKLKERELTVEGGTISISSVYSQGLLSTLTQALQSSGVDLSQASISVKIELGKQSSGRATGPPSTIKDIGVPSSNQGTTRSRVASTEESDQVLKRLKTGNT
ncbi:transcription factor BIM1-like [Juglans microcarpa x Juglans regia]|uniref:transcription factor BIM1-like n=1 Tax=Juglans microcarpa x Juglans regia TaxID=2249226 RepID=UPI001B7EBBE0|nr:transcription factor BIM1-like [Juglans microcarpa x Juglans regia]